MLTEGCPILDIVTEQVSRADGGELGKSLQQALRLCSLSNSRRANKNHTCCFSKSHSMRVLWKGEKRERGGARPDRDVLAETAAKYRSGECGEDAGTRIAEHKASLDLFRKSPW